MTDDFLERLRAMPSSLNDALRTLDFAADYIEELRRLERIDALIANQLSQSMAVNAGLKNRIDALEKEDLEMRSLMMGWKALAEHRAVRIEELETALRQIVNEGSWQGAPIKTPQSTEEMVSIAIAALAQSERY